MGQRVMCHSVNGSRVIASIIMVKHVVGQWVKMNMGQRATSELGMNHWVMGQMSHGSKGHGPVGHGSVGLWVIG